MKRKTTSPGRLSPTTPLKGGLKTTSPATLEAWHPLQRGTEGRPPGRLLPISRGAWAALSSPSPWQGEGRVGFSSCGTAAPGCRFDARAKGMTGEGACPTFLGAAAMWGAGEGHGTGMGLRGKALS